ncbi:MAG TPA: 4'-phosphopantetheinyl transferase superfamily protein, partial [Thermoanaerobaculia bacterium]|nr:4'-phosphopantetheinyl transferase superfamily protein [Thermoanaerobaculia bacterium]
MSLFRDLLPSDVLVAEVDPWVVDVNELHPAESACVANAVRKRRREFAAGRLLARDLLGRRAIPLLNDRDNVPLWPADVCGSITHCERLAAVAIADAKDVAGLGIDVEPAFPLPEDIAPLAVQCIEQEGLALMSPLDRALAGRAIFSAKETTYKALYAQSRMHMDFSDLVVRLDLRRGTFSAVLQIDVPGFSSGAQFDGRIDIQQAF